MPKQAATGATTAAAGPQTLAGFADQVLAQLAPNEQSVLRLAGFAAGAGGQGRVPGQGEPDTGGATSGTLAAPNPAKTLNIIAPG